MGGHKEESFGEDRWMGEGGEEAGVGAVQWLEALMRLEMGSA